MAQGAKEIHCIKRSMAVNIVSWNVRGRKQASKRCLIKNLIHCWKVDVYCLKKSKIEGDIKNIVKDLWANRWAKFCQHEARGTRGGILILWDGKVWT